MLPPPEASHRASVLIAGAGPAGARLALQLARRGLAVTLVEALASADRQAFSSAAMPLASALELQIPQSCWASRWTGWQLLDPEGHQHQWWAHEPLGVVLDFAALRSQFWSLARAAGVELLLNTRVELSRLDADAAEVRLVDADGCVQQRRVRWLIDATGARRGLLKAAGVAVDSPDDPLLSGTGAEWLLQCDDRRAAPWLDRLSFFLGSRWVHHGYGWIFPMDHWRLKVGVCRLPPRGQSLRSGQALGDALKTLLRACGLEDCQVLDRHGGTVSSTIRRQQSLGRDALIAIGDAASTANLLGGEGIRHALISADCLADALTSRVERPRLAYETSLQGQLGWRWPISGRLARRTWGLAPEPRADQRMTRLIDGLSRHATAEDLSALLFDYRFERYGIRLLPYLLR
ncbi:FAD-dependent monooxygenase [Parasynechococcus sp.]|uniref:FAD-dependent monooxygenase n=1 Tax=Parasynechococcus sp. TaxID=3101203 RepID=UPI003703C509